MAPVSSPGGTMCAASAQRTPRSEERTRPISADDAEDGKRAQRAGKRDCHQRRRHHHVEGAHGAQEVAVADTIGDDAEGGRQQRADVQERPEQRQQPHRAGLDQDVPAQDERLHLEGAGGEEVGRPLKAEAANLERCQHRRAERARSRRLAAVWHRLTLPRRPRRALLLAATLDEAMPAANNAASSTGVRLGNAAHEVRDQAETCIAYVAVRARSMNSGRSALLQSGMAAIFFSFSSTSAWPCM